MKIIYLITILILLTNCGQKEQVVKFESTIESDTTSVLIDSNNFYYLDLVENKTKNYLTFIIRNKFEIRSVCGFGNTVSVKKGKCFISDTINFGNDAKQEYLLKTYVFGSTYGAEVNYILYKSSEWELFRIPFDRNEVVFNEKMNDYEIIRYENEKVTGHYRFLDGTLDKQ